MLYAITRERDRGSNIMSVSIDLYMHVARHNERERERPEYIVRIEYFCTCMLYVITRERKKGTNILSVSSVSVHACCTL